MLKNQVGYKKALFRFKRKSQSFHRKSILCCLPEKTMQGQRKNWLSERCSLLKYEDNVAQTILDELSTLTDSKLSKSVKDDLESAITYFSNNITKDRMNYAFHMDKQLPIGSGVAEAACKTSVKQRLCGSGMRWKMKGAKVVLSLRVLVPTTNKQFWDKIIQGGGYQIA